TAGPVLGAVLLPQAEPSPAPAGRGRQRARGALGLPPLPANAARTGRPQPPVRRAVAPPRTASLLHLPSAPGVTPSCCQGNTVPGSRSVHGPVRRCPRTDCSRPTLAV